MLGLDYKTTGEVMDSYHGSESEAGYTRSSEILVKNPHITALFGGEKGGLKEILTRLPQTTFQNYASKSLQANIRTPDVDYEQRSTFKILNEAPDFITHELNWIDYKRLSVQTLYQDLKSTFVQLQMDQAKKIQTQIPLKYDDLIVSAIEIGFVPSGTFKRVMDNDFEAILNLTFAGKSAASDRLPVFPNQGISDGVLSIVPTLDKHTDAFFSEQKDAISAYWSIFPTRTYSEVSDFCNKARLNNFLGQAITATVIENSTQQAVGRVHLRPVVPPSVADVGYGIFPSHRGKGYATKALRLFTDWIFSEVNYVRIELGIKAGNDASEKVARACGYVRESSCPCRLKNQDGSFSAQISYAKINPVYGSKGEKSA